MFIEVLVIITQMGKQPKCSSTGECYSAIQRKELLTNAAMWMNLKDIMHNQSQRLLIVWFTFLKRQNSSMEIDPLLPWPVLSLPCQSSCYANTSIQFLQLHLFILIAVVNCLRNSLVTSKAAIAIFCIKSQPGFQHCSVFLLSITI